MSRSLTTAATATASALSVAAALIVAPAVQAEPAAPETTCQTPSFEVESGSIDWGIKQSWRKYIQGPIAAGSWTVAGMTESAGDKAGESFTFSAPIDPASVKLTTKDGKPAVTSLNTTGDVHFLGHHGALDVQLGNFGVEVAGNDVSVNTDYTTYYVPGKPMTSLTEADKTEANKVTGRDVVAQGTNAGWKLDGQTLTLATSDLTYAKNNASTREKLEGIDRAFMGAYQAGDPMDAATVTVKLKPTCNDPVKEDPNENPKEEGKTTGSSLASFGSSTTGGIIAALLAIFGVAAFGIAKQFGFIKF